MKKLIALGLLLALLLSGCAGTAKDPAPTEPTAAETTEAATEPETTDEPLAAKTDDGFGLSYLPEYGLNPYTCLATVNRAAFSLLYESLFVVSGEFRAVPQLCQSFRVSEDGTTYYFTLVPGVTFSDGTLLTAQDVVASIQAARNSGIYRARLSHIYDISAEADGTIVILLDTPYENFAPMLDVPVVKADSVEAQTPTGSGPYYLRGETLVRNPKWVETVPLCVDTDVIQLSPVETPNDLRDAFEFGGTDLVYCDPNSVAAGGYRCDYEAWEVPTTVMHYIGFNLYSGYFVNDTLRTAVTYAIDRNALSNEVYKGFAQPSVLPCNPLSDYYDEQLAKDYDYAPARFAEAVANSRVTTSEDYLGHVGIFLVCSDDPKRVAAAERIAEKLKSAGLNITVNAVDREQYLKDLDDGDFDLYYGETRLTPNFDLTEFFTKYGNLQFGAISSTGLAALCNSALKNSGSFYDLCGQLLQTAPICPVVFKSNAILVTRGVLSNITPGVDFVFLNTDGARTLSDADVTYGSKTDPATDATEPDATEAEPVG